MSRIPQYLQEMEAMTLVSEGKYAEALPLYERLVHDNQFQNRDLAYNNLAICYLKAGRYSDARFYLETLLESEPGNKTAQFNLAYCLSELKEYTKARVLLEALAAQDKKSPDISYQLGICALSTHDIPAAREAFLRLLTPPLSPGLIYNSGIQMIQKGEPGLARDFFIDYLQLMPGDIDALFGLGIAYARLAEHHQAVECLERVVAADMKRYPSAIVSLGVSYYELKNIREALKCFQKAVEIDPQSQEAWYYQGLIFDTRDEYDQALVCYRRAGELDHRMADNWEKLGLLHLKMGHPQEARMTLKKAYKLSGKTALAFQIALLFMGEKDYQSALEYFDICRQVKGAETVFGPELDENTSLCHYYLENFDQAVRFAEDALKNTRRPQFVTFILGNSMARLGRISDARRMMEYGLSLSPRDVNLLYSLGILEGSLERYENAERHLCQALQLDRNPDILYALALTRMKRGNLAESSDLLWEYQQAHKTELDVVYKTALLFVELKDKARARASFAAVLRMDPEHFRAQEYLKELDSGGKH